MRWKGRRGSENVEDRRSMSSPKVIGGGLAGIILVIVVILLGGDPQQLLQPGPNQPQVGQGPAGAEQDEAAEMVSVVLADTEEVWTELFNQAGEGYRKPTLTLFNGQVQSACGYQNAATGPFYCPGDEHVYIDLSFFEEMKQRFDAPGDFAQAYVIAHEVGHHVQNLLGISGQVDRKRQQVSETEANELSVRLELQADFLAGVWAHHAQQNWQILEEGDIDEALNAASAIGDDRLQRQARGYAVPESFTHGTSKQRKKWFYHGLKTGDMTQGDTFAVEYSRL